MLLSLLSACDARTEPTVLGAPTPDWAEREAWTGRAWPELESRGSEEYPPFFSAQGPLAQKRPDHARLAGRLVFFQPSLTLFHPDGVGGDRGRIGIYRDRGPLNETAEFVERFSNDIESARRLGRPWVWVRADRRVPWERVSRWVQTLGRKPARVSTFVFTFATTPTRGIGSLVAELRPAPPSLPVPIRLRTLTTGSDPEVQVDLGEAAWRFPEGPPYAGKEHVGRANENWRGIQAALQRRAPTVGRPLTVEVADDAPWAYVIQLLTIAAASGTTTVPLQATGLQLEVRLDEGDAEAATALRRVARGDPYGFTPGAWVFVGLLSGGAVGALLFLGGSRRRPGVRPSRGR